MRATVDLLRERGANVTTRDLADAAGVAEGTLFRVFPDKAALIHAAIEHALDPAPTVAELVAIPETTDLREAVGRAAQIMLERSRAVGSLLPVLHELRRSDDTGHGEPGAGPAGGHGAHGHHGPGGHRGPGGRHGRHPVATVIAAVTEVLEPHGDRLRHDPGTCAHMLVALILVSGRSMGFGQGFAALTADELAGLFLDGALVDTAPTPSTPTEEPPC